MLSDQCVSWSGWNIPWGMARLTPLSGGAYLQKTTSGVLQCSATFRFASKYPDSSVDNYFKILELARREPVDGEAFLFRFRDQEGWTSDVMIWQSPGGGDASSVSEWAQAGSPLYTRYEVTLDLMVPGYLP